MSEVWKTKYGPRRVRRDPPTVEEAVAAARGLTDDVQEQIEIAAALMDLSPDAVKPEVLKAANATRKEAGNTVAFVGRAGAPRTVVVERVSRRPASLAGKTGLGGKSGLGSKTGLGSGKAVGKVTLTNKTTLASKPLGGGTTLTKPAGGGFTPTKRLGPAR